MELLHFDDIPDLRTILYGLHHMLIGLILFFLKSVLWLIHLLASAIMALMQNLFGSGECHCARMGNPHKVRWYWGSRNKPIGFYCTECGVESLTKESLNTDIKTILEQNTAIQARYTETKVDLHNYADILKLGDHIMWHHMFGIWHHCIVSDIHVNKNIMGLIHWRKRKEELVFRIIEEHIEVNNDPMYRIHYPDSVTKANPAELVLARARSTMGDIGYNVFTNNCESFATFCKCGGAKSYQVMWLKEKISQIIIGNCTLVGKEFFQFNAIQYSLSAANNFQFNAIQYSLSAANNTLLCVERLTRREIVEQIVKRSNWIRTILVVVMEATTVAGDLEEAYEERRNGNITKKNFREILISRIFEGLLSSAFELIGYYIGTPFGLLGIILGGIVGGIVGGVLGKAAGTALGNTLSLE